MQNKGKCVLRRLAAWVVPGGLLLGTSCYENVRESAVAGSLGFVEDSAATVWEILIPIEDFLTGGGE